jgi:quercetin dioxygenase-like cupin family protein
VPNEPTVAYFQLDEVPWPEANSLGSTAGNVPKELIEKASRSGARRKFLAQGDGGFFSQYSEFPAGFTVPMHSHDHSELIVLLDGGCEMLEDGTTLRAGDSMAFDAGYEYGFTAGPDGMGFMTIRTGVAGTKLT